MFLTYFLLRVPLAALQVLCSFQAQSWEEKQGEVELGAAVDWQYLHTAYKTHINATLCEVR